MRLRTLTALILACLLYGSTPAVASEITRDLKTTIDRVLVIVNDQALKDDKDARRDMLRDTIDQRFNYEQMAMRALARAWPKRTAEERKQFVASFKKLLEMSYANKIESFGEGSVDYLDEVVKGDYALVKTKVVRKNKSMNVDYKMVREKEAWQVYDIVVEGVSMIRNYRSQFTKIIQEESFDVLMQKITTTNM